MSCFSQIAILKKQTDFSLDVLNVRGPSKKCRVQSLVLQKETNKTKKKTEKNRRIISQIGEINP
jgi:hypothetical protein